VKEPAIIKTNHLAAFGVIAAVTALCGLTMVPIVAPGCTGPVSEQPCDYVASFKTASTRFHGHSPYFSIEVLDVGSSVYVRQTAPPDSSFILHTPGALIDKKSCRVCRADGYAAYGDDDGLRVLARYPSDKPLSSRPGPGLFGY
jgi:hypothetical protein